MSTTILAIDLGKFNSVLCWYDPALRDARFRTVATTPDDLRRELNRHSLICLRPLFTDHHHAPALRPHSLNELVRREGCSLARHNHGIGLGEEFRVSLLDRAAREAFEVGHLTSSCRPGSERGTRRERERPARQRDVPATIPPSCQPGGLS